MVLACGFLVSLRFKLNLHTHSVLRSETLRMRELGYAQSEQTSAEHRAVVELLAGCLTTVCGAITILAI